MFNHRRGRSAALQALQAVVSQQAAPASQQFRQQAAPASQQFRQQAAPASQQFTGEFTMHDDFLVSPRHSMSVRSGENITLQQRGEGTDEPSSSV